MKIQSILNANMLQFKLVLCLIQSLTLLVCSFPPGSACKEAWRQTINLL